MNKPDEGSIPHTEPLVVSDAFATGVDVEPVSTDAANGDLRLIAWVDHGDERRIVARIVCSDSVARSLMKNLKRTLTMGSH